MATEAWLNGKLNGFAPILMPAAHALVECAKDLEKYALRLSDEELRERPKEAPSVAFHLRHIAGSIDRLLTYARNEQLSEAQFAELKLETVAESVENAEDLTNKAIGRINEALDELRNISPEILFDERFVGREKLPTNVFGLLFHIAEHTARHTGQMVTTTKIVRRNC
jgi:uncharacterized damage-inducible protein DinB